GCPGVFIAASAGLPGAVPRGAWTTVPVLAADASPMQEALRITEYRMPQHSAALVGDGADDSALARALPGTAPVARTGSVTVTAQQAYGRLLGQLAGQG